VKHRWMTDTLDFLHLVTGDFTMLTNQSIGLLRKWLGDQDVPFDEGTLEILYCHQRMVLDRSRTHNITRIVDEQEFVVKHMIDSLSVVLTMLREEVDSFIDVGSGAGFPGIPVKVTLPHTQAVLLDSSRRKVDFLDKAIGELALSNVTTRWDRAETAAKTPELREVFDAALVRALKELRIVVELALPFVRTGGILIAQKGPACREEVKSAETALAVLGGTIERTECLTLPQDFGDRVLLIIRKVGPCPLEYPRRPGLPEKRPL